MSKFENHPDFLRLFSQHQRDVKAYIRALVPSAADADDVMQETSKILWEKFSDYDPDRDFGRWACGVARMVVLRLRQKAACDKHWFNVDLLELISSERVEREASYWEDRRGALQECIEALDSRQQEFLELRYGKSMSVDAVSREAGRPVSTMYRLFSKLRKSLFDCVSWKLDSASRS